MSELKAKSMQTSELVSRSSKGDKLKRSGCEPRWQYDIHIAVKVIGAILMPYLWLPSRLESNIQSSAIKRAYD